MGTVPLIDMLEEAVLRTGCLTSVTASAGRGDLAPEVLAERLPLAIYAYGTSTGIRAIVGSARHGSPATLWLRWPDVGILKHQCLSGATEYRGSGQ